MESFSGKMSFSQCFKTINCPCCGGKNSLYVVGFHSRVLFLSFLNVYVAVMPKDSKQTKDATVLGKKKRGGSPWPERLMNQFLFALFHLMVK